MKLGVASAILIVFANLAQCKIEPSSSDYANDDEDQVKVVYSVVSGTAHLPCNITPPLKGDRARLVLWYRGQDPQPVYSFDARFTTVKHWSEDQNFSPRAYFRDTTDPAQLIISNVDMADADTYKCRVDFRQSQTVTTEIKLDIIDEPQKPVIMDSEGSAVMGTVGPFRLKQALILVCLVEGGMPTPEVIWFRDGVVWDREVDPSTYEDVLQNTLVISELDRGYHDSTFECRAINNNVTEPPKSSVTILLEMPILSMTIANLEDPVKADKTYQVLCQVTGAQPPPEVSWSLDGQPLPTTDPRLTHSSNLTTSQLVFTPKITDQGKVLTCTADNKVFPAVNRSSSLNVYYLPVVHIELGDATPDPSNIREGDTLKFRCLIQAHPWVWRILWYRDGEELKPSDDVTIEEQILTIKNVTKAMSGQYVCSAANVEGDGFSKALKIAINYRPVCAAPTIQHKENGIDLLCQVDSKPSSSTYRWLFNSSETTFEIPSAESTMSFSNYRPSTDEDHGQVLCWASNGLGEQIKPCVFHVVPLATPEPPKDCKISNHTASTVEVRCKAGFGGGLSQHFVMEVFENVNNTQVLVATNWTNEWDLEDDDKDDPVLGVWGLLPDSDYIISVKAVNERGESSPVYVGGSTRISNGGRDGATWLPINGNGIDDDENRRPLLFVIVGILVTLMILGALITAILAVRRRKMAKLTAIEVKSATNTTGNSSPASNPEELQDPLLQDVTVNVVSSEQTLLAPKPNAIIQRKVSFREEDLAKAKEAEDAADYQRLRGGNRHQAYTCPECEYHLRQQQEQQSNGSPSIVQRSSRSSTSPLMPPVQRAIVRAFSIDKMRPVCPVCNPVGDTPYPDDLPKHTQRLNGSHDGVLDRVDNDDDDVEEVQRLNNELDELQKCLLSGAAALAAAVEEQDNLVDGNSTKKKSNGRKKS